MDNMTEADLAAALADVRRSYRVVAAYQRRINEIFHRFHLAVQDAGLSFQWWAPDRCAAPMKWDKVQFAPNKWAWDLLPGFSLSAVWMGAGKAGKPVRRVWLGVETDTGWRKGRGVEPDPRDFDPVESSSTVLWVERYISDGALAEPAWERLYPAALAGRWEQGLTTEIDWAFEGRRGTYRCDRVPVETLVGREELDDRLIGPTLAWLRAEGTTNG